MEPSNTVGLNHRTDLVRMKDGRTFTGEIIPQLDFRSPHLLMAPDVFTPDKTIKLLKSDIANHRKSDVSLMPSGLLDTFRREEILDLIAFIESGGK